MRQLRAGAGTRVAVSAAVVLALGWRCFYLLRLRSSPVADLLEMDSRIYWEWATTLLRDGWFGSRQFFMGPLYPYLLAVVRLATGTSVFAIQILQSLLSVATIGLLAWLVTRVYGWRWGLAMGCLLAGYGPWIFMDAQILMEPLLLALQALWLLLIIAGWDQPNSVHKTVALGGLVGLMALGRGTNLLLSIPTAAYLCNSMTRGSRGRHVLLMTLMVGLVAVPTTVRSFLIGRELIPYTYGLGYNFYIGNGEGATGVFRNLPESATTPPDPAFEGGAVGDGRDILLERTGTLLTPRRSSAVWFDLAMADVAGDPARWAILLGRKSALVMNRQEATQIQSPLAFAQVAGPIGWPWIGGFGFLGLLGLAGVLVGALTGEKYRLLAFAWTFLAMAPIVFFVTDRYRIHLIPTMLLLAPLGLRTTLALLTAKQPLRRIAGALPLSVSALLVFQPLVESSREKQRFDVATTLASAYLQQGREDDAAQSLEEAIAIDQKYSLPGAETSTGRAARADVYAMHANLAMSKGNWARAIDDLQTAVGLVPEDSHYAMALSIALAANGEVEPARRLMPGDALGRAALRDEILMRIRDCESHQRHGAMEGYLRALSVALPHWEPAVVALARYLIMQGRGSEAEHLLELELHHGLRLPVYQVHVAAVRAGEGRLSESLELLRAIPGKVRAHDPIVIATMQVFDLAVK